MLKTPFFSASKKSLYTTFSNAAKVMKVIFFRASISWTQAWRLSQRVSESFLISFIIMGRLFPFFLKHCSGNKFISFGIFSSFSKSHLVKFFITSTLTSVIWQVLTPSPSISRWGCSGHFRNRKSCRSKTGSIWDANARQKWSKNVKGQIKS